MPNMISHCTQLRNRRTLVILVLSFLVNGLLIKWYFLTQKSAFFDDVSSHEQDSSVLTTNTSLHERESEIVYAGTTTTTTIEPTVPPPSWMKENIVNPFTYGFTHNPHKACSGKRIELVIAVPVSRSLFYQRRTIRETWGSYGKDPSTDAVLLFFLGNGSSTESPDVQRKIDEESIRYGDIVQSEFSDTYQNLSIKSMSILRWVDAFCPQTDFLVKADDDMYVVVPKLLMNLKTTAKNDSQKQFILGFVITGAMPIQDKDSKWYTPKDNFPETFYPNYAAGCAYSMTGKAARLLFQAALRTPLFWLEDVYITGICSRKAGVRIVCDNSFTYNTPPANGCSFRKYTTGHRYTSIKIRKIHKDLHDKNLICGH